MIPIEKKYLLQKVPKHQRNSISEHELIAWAARKGHIQVDAYNLKMEIEELRQAGELNDEQFRTLQACLKSKDFSRIINNKKIKQAFVLV